jgi:amino acid adenylation domain-containing protein
MIRQHAGNSEAGEPSTVSDHIDRQVRERPDATAVIGSGDRLTYRELLARADALAAMLAVAPETPVAVCTRRRPYAVIAMLAAMRAGGACVPVDPAYPRERIGHILADSGCPVVLTDPESRSLLPCGLRAVDATAAVAAPNPAWRPPRITPDQASTVLYTSGSTGRPKGVVVSHRNVLALVTRDELLRHEPGDMVAHVLSSSFDAVLLDVWGALVMGATVWLGSDEVLRSAGHLLEEINGVPLTTLSLTSSLVHQVVQLRPERLSRIPRLWFGGEAAETAAVLRLHDASTRLVHHYGPTECTSIATVHRVTEADAKRPVIPIGRSVASARIYLLDPALRPVPSGEPGELYIGGLQVTRGFLGNPRLTADRFLPDPYAGDGARMYRTGDVAMVLPGGEFQFLGRGDDQVKIRGYRVELAEVTSALRAVPGVTDAAVVARDDVVPGAKALVGYVVGPVAEQTLAAHLARTLPEYMVPAAYVSVPEIPALPNRKVNARALPAPPRSRPAGSSPDCANPPREQAARRRDAASPIDDVYDRLAALWCEILQLDAVAPTDNFFALGGYSLLAARLVARVEQTFHTRLPLRTLFTARTLRDLATAVARELPPVDPDAGPDGPVMSPAQRELWFLDRLNPGSHDYNSPMAYRVDGPLDLDVLRRAMAEVARRHEVLRWRFRTEKGRPVVEVAERLDVEPAVADADGADDATVLAWLTERRNRPFNLATEPLLRVDVLRTSPDRAVLLITVHHIVFDGWSHGIFVRELGALYRAYAAGRPSPLPELPHRYSEVVWREAWALEQGQLDPQLQFWRKSLGGAPPAIALPPPGSGTPAGAAVVATGAITGELAAAVRTVARMSGWTPFTLLLSGFGLALRALTRVEDVVVACPNAGRRGGAGAAVLGLFAHLLPIRIRCADSHRLADLVDAVGENVTGAFVNQSVPFDRIVQELRPPRQRGARAPFTQLVFNLVDLAEEPLDFGGSAVTPIRVPTPETRVPVAVILNGADGGYRVEVLVDPAATAPGFAEAVAQTLPRAVELVTHHGDRGVAEAAAVLAEAAPGPAAVRSKEQQ